MQTTKKSNLDRFIEDRRLIVEGNPSEGYMCSERLFPACTYSKSKLEAVRRYCRLKDYQMPDNLHL
jgi:hypothetical protein